MTGAPRTDREALRQKLMEDVRMSWRQGGVGGVRVRLLAAGIVTWVDGRGDPCVSLAKAAKLLGVARPSLIPAVRRGRLPATRGSLEQAGGRVAPWLVPLGHVLAYQVNTAMQALGRVGGQQTAARRQILRSLLRNDDCPEDGRSVMD